MLETKIIRHGHLYCGLGGGAKGFNRGEARVGNLRAQFKCIGGIDVDPAAVRDFEHLSGAKGTVLDLFSRDQYIAFHGHEPPAGWREAVRSDIVHAFNNERPNIIFLSAPCLPADGMVITEGGARPISSISPGDRVLTHRGRYRTVDRVNRRPYVGELFGLRVNGSVDLQWYTEEHPIWVRRVHRSVRTGRSRALGDAAFIPAKQVRIGDRVGFSHRRGDSGYSTSFRRPVRRSDSC